MSKLQAITADGLSLDALRLTLLCTLLNLTLPLMFRLINIYYFLFVVSTPKKAQII